LGDLPSHVEGEKTLTMVISAVAGTAGVGKTALAVHWAHLIRGQFPDGDLYVNLRGFDAGPPAAPEEVLDGFLRAFDVAPGGIPAGLDAKTGLFRSLLHNRRVLIILDNAANPEQARPLLPASSGCLVIITSRSSLSGLVARDGARRITLDVLTESDAVTLLRKIIGERRAEAERQAIAQLANLCVYLPLALRIAAERVAVRPHAPIAEIAAELSVERERLDALATTDNDETAAVRSVFSFSYRALAPNAARVFRLVGLHAGADIGVDAVAAGIDTTVVKARRALQALTDAHVLEEGAGGRYRLHDLLREYAIECAERDETAQDRVKALRRLLDWYLHTARAASAILDQQRMSQPPPAGDAPAMFATHHEALTWYKTELDNLIAAIRQAAQLGEYTTTVQLSLGMRSFFQLHKSFDAWTKVNNIGLTAARRTGDRHSEARLLWGLGAVANYSGRPQERLAYGEQATAILRELGPMEAMQLVNLGSTYEDVGRYDEAIDLLSQGLIRARDTGDQAAEGHALESLSQAYLALGQHGKAVTHAGQALTVFRDAGLTYGQAVALGRLADCALELQQFDTAIRYGQQSLEISTAIGDRSGQAWAAHGVAVALRRAGQLEAANQHWHHALATFRNLGVEDMVARVLFHTAVVLSELGRHEEALAATTEAVEIHRRLAAVDPAAFEPGLAAALWNFARVRVAGQAEFPQALAATQESSTHYEALVHRLPQAFMSDLHGALATAADVLEHLDRPDDAALVRQTIADLGQYGVRRRYPGGP
jgi:tetratricopeptide (TPR) repeat protein